MDMFFNYKNGTENYLNINKVTLYHDYKKKVFLKSPEHGLGINMGKKSK